MNLSDALGYRHRPPNVVQRAGRRFASTRFGAWMFSKVLRHVDRLLARSGRGRTFPELVAGLPVLFVTTVGAKSGAPRRSALVGVPVGDDLALIGTNFGERSTPNWYHNLRVHPHATVSFHDRSARVRARVADAEERIAIMRTARDVYVGYGAYERRITDRTIPIMLLQADETGELRR